MLRIAPSRESLELEPNQHQVLLAVSDSRGGIAIQPFTIQVHPDPTNHPPVIITDAVTEASPGVTYAYDVDAIDPDDDGLEYSLVEQPDRMTIDPLSGEIDWSHPLMDSELDFAAAFGTHPNTHLRDVTFDAAGNLYAVGYFWGTVDFDPGPNEYALSSQGQSDGFVVKYDVTGNLAWARNVGGSSYDGISDVAFDDVGNVYLCGSFYSGDFDADPGPSEFILSNEGGSWDGWAVEARQSRRSRLGETHWQRAAPTSNFSLDLDQAGNIYIAGDFAQTVDFDSGPC